MNIYLSNDGAIEFLSDSTINRNTINRKRLEVTLETALTAYESLWVQFGNKQNYEDASAEVLEPIRLERVEGSANKYFKLVPSEVVTSPGRWYMSLAVRKYSPQDSAVFIEQLTSEQVSFTVSDTFPAADGGYVSNASMESYYNDTVEASKNAKKNWESFEFADTMEVQVETLPEGSDATAEVSNIKGTENNAKQFLFKLGIPRGATGGKGDKGDTGDKGDKGDKGDPFTIAATFASVAEMNAGYATDGVPLGAFVAIDTGNVEDEDNAKLYLKGNSGYGFITDLSGTQGLRGIGISSATLTYAQSSTATQPTSWSSTQPTPTAGYYMHYRLAITYTDGTTDYKYWYIRNGLTGASGADGAPCYFIDDPDEVFNAVGDIAEIYPDSFSPIEPNPEEGSIGITQNGFLCKVIGTSGAQIILECIGDFNGQRGTGISSTTLSFAQSTSTARPSSWSTTQPEPIAGQYLHCRLTIKYSNGGTAYQYWYVLNGADGAQGEKGNTGDPGAIYSVTGSTLVITFTAS